MSYISQSRGQVVFVCDEATYGVQAKPVTGDAIKVLTTNLDWTQERRERMDKTAFRSQRSQINGRKSATFEIVRYLATSGTYGAPDDSELWLAATGTLTSTATNLIYSPDTDGDGNWDDKSFTIYSRVDAGSNTTLGDAMESVYGAIVDQVVVSFSGSEEAKVTFSGPAKEGVFTGNTSLATNIAGGATTFTTDEARHIHVGSLCQIGTNVGAGTGLLVTAVDSAKTGYTTESSIATQASGNLVIPYLPAETVTDETPIFGGAGSVRIGGATMRATDGSWTLNKRSRLINDEHGTDSASAVSNPATREVTFTATGYMHREMAPPIYRAALKASAPVILTIGGTAKDIVAFSMPQTELDVTTMDVGVQEEVMITVSGKAVATATGDDDFSVIFR